VSERLDAPDGQADLRLGRWQDVLADVECDAWISDPPYGERTHRGHDAIEGTGDRAGLGYAFLRPEDVREIVEHWSPRTRGWMCAMTSHDLIPHWEDAFEAAGRYYFAPLPVLEFYRPRLLGDGPGSRAVQLVVARPRTREFLSQNWGSLPGDYRGPLPADHLPRGHYERSEGEGRAGRMGGKSLAVMRSIVRDYSRLGDVVCDPFAGYGTTLLAALMEGRRAVGSEMDPEAHAAARDRLGRGYVLDLFSGAGQAAAPTAEQRRLWEGE
jgi:hypothetical protein